MTTENKEEQISHHIGHRQRLKEKFLNNDPANFADYELLELLLFQAMPRKDVKPIAKEMLKIFGSFNRLINSEDSKFMEVGGATQSALLQIKIVKEIMNRIFLNQIENTNIISSWSALLDYLKFNMGCLNIEQFRVLFLNKKNRLIADEIMATGTIDQTPVYPREIVKKSILHNAGAIILVHNHPSGDNSPSNADINLTTQIVNACNTVNVSVHDHIIIGGNEYYSFKSNMLL